MKDKAGNVNDNTSTVFTVNRFGSSYYLSEGTKRLTGSGNPYINSPVPIEITEINVNSLKESRVSVRNEHNEIKTLKEGDDYLLKKRENRYAWHEYSYHIRPESFMEEGQYSVTVSSVDEAENQMTNAAKNQQIRFVVDKTPPYGVIAGLEKKIYKEKRHAFTIRADDNYALKEAVLYINGRKKKVYGPEDFLYEDGITVQLDESRKMQRVTLQLTDRAGNTVTILPRNNPYGSLITTDRTAVAVHNIPLIILAVFMSLAGTLAAVRFIRKKYSW